ncbi:hypothetical protein ACLOJK_003157 [Asimina triloba]
MQAATRRPNYLILVPRKSRKRSATRQESEMEGKREGVGGVKIKTKIQKPTFWRKRRGRGFQKNLWQPIQRPSLEIRLLEFSPFLYFRSAILWRVECGYRVAGKR